ncbi:MAG TPA: ribulose-phosphate 3-epimerase [Spirochaetia bacterium]|nr:ribulose-phosphate 3-epimerase [Spirochaetia bacterium]
MHEEQNTTDRPPLMDRKRKVFVAPSVLSADFGSLGDAVRLVEKSGGDFVHLDVMDGCFVPQITFGEKAVTDLRPVSKLPFDTHLMICQPEHAIDGFCEAGTNYLTVHWEAATHIHRILTTIRHKGCKPGIAIVPSTPAEAIVEVLSLVDIVLVMTVNPGFGGQQLIPQCLRKVETLDKMRRAGGHQFLIEVDGGINRSTIKSALNAGADVIVAGSAVFTAADPAEEVAFLRGAW